MTRKRCSRCYHELPGKRNTWSPYWSLWPKCDGFRLTYASDGPALGFVIKFTEAPGPSAPNFDRRTDGQEHKWEAWVIEEPPNKDNRRWSYMKRVGSSTVILGARKMVEAAVRTGGLWP